MNWGFPYAFLFLLGALPLIVFLHSLRSRGIRVKTTTLFLWERVLRERPLGTRLGWLVRKNLLLIIQLLIALAFIAALADPSLRRYGAGAGDTVVVLDLSASMKARGRSGSRFDEARREYLSLIDAMHSGQKMMVIGAGPIFRVLSPFTADKRRLKEVARSVEPTDAPADVKEAVLFAHSFLKPGSPDRVAVLSDGAFEGAEGLPWHSSHLRLVRVDGGGDNIGIVGFELRRMPDRPNRYEIMVRVKNFMARPVRAPVNVTLGAKGVAEEVVEIGANQSKVLIYPYEGPLEGRAAAHLGIEDDFPTDNHAYLALAGTPPLRVLYAGRGNPFLSHLFRLLPHLQVTQVDGLAPRHFSSQLREYDVIIVDGIPSPPLTEGNFILLNTVAEGLPLKAAGRILRPLPLPAVIRHPLTEGVRFDDLTIREAANLIPEAGAKPLVRSKDGPLMVAVEKGRLRAFVIGFDLLASDLPFKVAFPVLFSNAFDWFQPKQAEFPATKVQAGSPVPLYLSALDDQVEVKAPSGRKEILRAASNPLSFADTLEAGFYGFKTKSREGEFAVNLLSESESEVRPRVGAVEASSRPGGSEVKLATGFSLWPYLLVLVLLSLSVEAWLAFRAGESLYPVAFRLLALSGVFLALVNPRIFKPASGLDVIVGVDFSRSVGQEGRDSALRVLETARRVTKPETRTGLFSFGRQTAWEFFPRGDFPLSDFSSEVGREETNIEAALQAAMAQIGEGRQGRILLVSDGNENRGAASRVVPLLRSRGVPVWILSVSRSQGKNEVYLSDLALPSQVDSAEGFEARVAIESLTEAPARVKLLLNGVIRREEAIKLRPGTNWVSFRESLTERGSHTYEFLVEATEDTLPENNLLQGVVEVKGPPRLLYLRSQENSQRFLPRALAAQGYSVVESSPEGSPLSLPELLSFDMIVLDNVPAYRLTLAKMEAMERYVRDLGGGLMVIGGPQSYGAGGYYKTPLERLLPVEMRPPARIELPHVALLFVLDKSGSMGAGAEGATKLDLAKAAAMAAADLLNPSDQVGILAFDAAWDWALPFRPVGKGEWISESLSSLQSDGGTDLYKALVEAHRVFSAKQAAIKHVLILSDGLTDKMDFHSLLGNMARAGITVSTVAVGQDADSGLMAGIAQDGKGRAYVTVDPKTIPQIFTAETLLVARDLLVEKLAYPRIVAPSGPLKGIGQKSIPPVRGYVLTHPKPRADLLMKVEDNPLLSSWRYGLGQVVAFTSDLSGRWGKEWVQWDDFPRWAGQLARSAMRKISEHRLKSEFHQEGEDVRAVVDLLSGERNFVNNLNLKGNVTGPDQSASVRSFRQIAPGRYETNFSIPQRGIYLLTVYREGGEGEAAAPVSTLPFIASYPREYRELKPNQPFLSRLAEETGGELLDPDKLENGVKRLFTPDPGKASSAKEGWWTFSGLGLLLFLGDLALRRWPHFSSRR